MLSRLSIRLLWTLCLLVFLMCTVPASAQVANPKANLDQAVQALQKAEQLVANEPEAALAAAKEARQIFKNLQKVMADKLYQNQLTDAQLEQEELNLKVADDLFKKGEIFQKSAKEKLARSQELESQGDSAAAQNLEGVAQIEGRLALQNFVRSEIFSLKNQQMVFESLLKPKK
jgi:exonuclease VII small subunit